MKITYFTGLVRLESESMKTYRINLLKGLKEIDSNFKYKEYAMKHFELNINNFHIDRIFNRYILYQLFAKRNYSQINHVLDHTYACAFNLLPKNVKKIVTVHDLFLLGGRINEFRIISVPGIKKADKVIADSESTKKDLINYLKIPESKVEVIYLGVDRNIFKPKNFENTPPELRNKKIILSVANCEERKNTVSVVKAFINLLRDFEDLVLVRVGAENSKTTNIIKESSIEKKVFYYNNISENLLVNLYNLADVFVFPSIKEGFGFPVLEAMACGCPVITSSVTSLPEIAGDGAIMIDPYNLDALIIATKKVLTNKNLRKKMTEKGFKQAERFNWSKTAKKTMQVYEEVSFQRPC